MHTYCQMCGKRIKYSGKGRPPKYCKSCFKKYREDYFRFYWQRNKDRYRDRVKARLGTTDFSPHIARKPDGTPDWEKEMKEIEEEMRRLRIRRR